MIKTSKKKYFTSRDFIPVVFSYFNEFFRMVVHTLREILERFYLRFPGTNKLQLFMMIKYITD